MVNRAIQCERTQNIETPFFLFTLFSHFIAPISRFYKRKRGVRSVSLSFSFLLHNGSVRKKEAENRVLFSLLFFGVHLLLFAAARTDEICRDISIFRIKFCAANTQSFLSVSHVVRWPMVTTAVQSQSIKFCRQFDSQLFGGLSLNSFSVG